MGVHCYLTELGILVTMAVKIVAVVVTLASLAAAEPGYGYGGAYHPYGGHSYTYRTTQGLTGHYGGHYGYGKREAEPGYGYGGIALHAYGGHSYTHRSPQGLHGHYGGYGYGHGYGHGYYGYGKRSAEPGYYGHASSFVHQSRPYHHGSYGYGIQHYGKRSADAGYYGYYGHGGASYQQVNRPYSHYGVSVAHPY